MTYLHNLPSININLPKITFRQNPTLKVTAPLLNYSDSYVTSPYENFFNVKELEALSAQNPNIRRILNEHGLDVKINTKTLEQLQKGHLKEARILTAKIYSSLPPELKHNMSMQDLQEAALLHDIGKIFIPDKILNKKGKLTDDERKIMELHSELGYELLKSKGIREEVLNLIKYHHQTPQKDGYPKVDDDWNYSISSEILRIADEYSALTEERPYKPQMSKEEALAVIYDDVKNGKISETVYNALKNSV